jgi:hypothetical protein
MRALSLYRVARGFAAQLFVSVVGVVMGLFASMGAAHAALPTELTTWITDATADTATLAKGVLLIVFGIMMYKWFRRSAS